MEFQHELNDRLVGLSLADTIYDCVMRKENERAEELRQMFGVKAPMFHRIQLRALVDRHAWGVLRSLSKERSFARCVSIEDIVDALTSSSSQSAAIEAAEYVDTLAPGIEKVTLLMKLRLWAEALQAGTDARSVQALIQLRDGCPEAYIRSQAESRMVEIAAAGDTGEDGGAKSKWAAKWW